MQERVCMDRVWLRQVQFPNLNLAGKYRVDVLALNAAGASLPKTIYFDARAHGRTAAQHYLSPKEVSSERVGWRIS